MIDVIMRKFSGPIARLISRTSITPNQITVSRILLAILSGLFFAVGSYFANMIALFFCLLNMLFDFIDGDLARLKSMESKVGNWLDHVLTDWISGNFTLLGIVFGVSVLGNDKTLVAIIAVCGIFAYNMNKFLTNQFEQKCNLWWGHIQAAVKKSGLKNRTSGFSLLCENIVFPQFPFGLLFMIGFPIMLGVVFNQMFWVFCIITLTFSIRWIFTLYIFLEFLREEKSNNKSLVKILKKLKFKECNT